MTNHPNQPSRQITRVTARIEMEPGCRCDDGMPTIKEGIEGEHLLCSICGMSWHTVWMTTNGMTTSLSAKVK